MSLGAQISKGAMSSSKMFKLDMHSLKDSFCCPWNIQQKTVSRRSELKPSPWSP